MGAGDALLARYQAEIEERSKFIDGVVEQAEKDERDLTEQEMTLLARTRDRIRELNAQVAPLHSTLEIAARARASGRPRSPQQFAAARNPARRDRRSSTGRPAPTPSTMWRAGLGNEDARERLALFNRAAAHQTTGDNPGLLPSADARPGHLVRRRGPADGQRPRPARPAVRLVEPAEDLAAHRRRPAVRRRRPSSSAGR